MNKFARPLLASLILFVFVVFPLSADSNKSADNNHKEVLIGLTIKNILESYHYSQKKMDDDVSEKAFKELLKALDYRKHFFLQSDVDELKKYAKELDDEFVSGNLDALNRAYQILEVRVPFVQKAVAEILSKPFDFKEKENFETDPDKRTFATSEAELKDVWKKTLKFAALSELMDVDEDTGLKRELNKRNKKSKTAIKKPAVTKNKPFKEQEEEARKKVAKDYDSYFNRLLKEKKMDRLSKFYNSVIRIFDPHTNYLHPDDREEFDISLSGKLEGIGAVLVQDGIYIKVDRIVPGSASWKQKELQPEDVILKVAQEKGEPVSIINMDIKDAVKHIRGEKGSTVKLTVKKPDNTTKVIPIIRDVVEMEESYARSVIMKLGKDGDKIGYLSLPSFYREFNPKRGEDAKNCTDDVKAELKKLNKEKISGLVLDLRNNGGGSLEDARLITGLFIKKGPVVQVKDHEGSINSLDDTDESVAYSGPMIVLINRLSASASEILAGALQDYGRAVIVGSDHSHGKGTVQTIWPLERIHALPRLLSKDFDALGSLKITIQQFYRVSGSSTQNKGVLSDIVLPDRMSFMETGERYLDYALPWEKVKPSVYTPWQGDVKFALDDLRSKNLKRQESNARFKKIQDYVTWMKEQKEKTNVTLVLEDFKKEQKARLDFVAKIEDETINKNLQVEHHLKIRDGIEKDRINDFIDEIKKDPYIEESIYVMEDILGKTVKVAG